MAAFISADGRFVSFSSAASNFFEGDDNRADDVLVHDRQTGTTECVSMGVDGKPANDASEFSSITPDGRFVVFSSNASNLVVGDTNGSNDIFVHDRQTRLTERVSVDSTGAEGSGAGVASRLYEHSSISADGRYVAFTSHTVNLVAGDTNGVADVFVRDRQNGSTTRISEAVEGAQGNEMSSNPSISSDGRFIAFESYASNSVSGDTNGILDVFVRDVQSGTNWRASVDDNGGQGGGISFEPSLTPDGRFLVFQSAAPNLVTGDRNGRTDVFVRGPAEQTRVIAVSTFPSRWGVVTGGGMFIEGSQRTVTATPSLNYRFVNWTENGSQVSTQSSYTFTLTADRDLVAHFSQVDYSVTTSAKPPEGGTTSGDGTYPSSTSVTLSAAPNPGYRFVNWTENGSQVSTQASYTFTLTADRDLVAHFSQVDYSVTTSAKPPEGGTTSGDGTYPSSTSVTLSAAPNPGYRFVNWTENGSQVSTQSSYTFTLTADRDLVAHFSQVDYSVTTSAKPPEGGTTSGDGTYPSSTSVTLSAAPNPGYRFVNWTENGSQVSTQASYTFTLTADRDLVAHFEALHVARNDLLVDLGTSGLFQRLNNGTSWLKIHNNSPIATAAGDLNGNGKDEAIAVFGNGTWIRYDHGVWRQLQQRKLLRLVTGDLDGNGQDDVIGDFAGLGVYAFINNTRPMVRLRTTVSKRLAIGDLDGNGKDDLVAIFANGTWVRYDTGQWTQLQSRQLLSAVTGDLDGNGKDDIVGNFASLGLYVFMNNTRPFVRVRATVSHGLTTGDLDGNGKDEIIAVFGNGTWVRSDAGPWTRIGIRPLLRPITGDLNGNGQDEIVGDFAGQGLFGRHNNVAPWVRLRAIVSQGVASGGFD